MWQPGGEDPGKSGRTIPLRARRPAGPPPASPGRGRSSPRRPRSRWRGFLASLVSLVVVLVLLGAVAFGALLLLTPSVSNAGALVRAQNLAHHAADLGPPVPDRFAAALEATEDHRFTEEPGVDPIAIVRVIVAHLDGRGDQGGATLYQQLAKVLYTQDRAGAAVELEQVALAVKLRFSYSAQQILQMYVGVVYFGHGFYGLQDASCGYFGTSPASLSWPQAALMAGLVQGPSADDPLTYPARARAREEHVLGRLVATGALTQDQASAALRIPVSTLVANADQGCSA